MQENNPTTGADLLRPNTFVQRFPDVVAIGGLRWQLNHSASNGLDAAGAVIRKHTRPNSKRPIVYIDVPKYFAWLRSDTKVAA